MLVELNDPTFYELKRDEKDLLSNIRNTKVKWTKENCAIEALKYTTRNEFHDRSRCAHKASSKGGWLDEVCAHMRSKGYKRTTGEVESKETDEKKRKITTDTLSTLL